MRPPDQYHAVSEILQADVMRFMAIIAFCLIAILALVRSVAPTSDTPRSDAVRAPLQTPTPEPAVGAISRSRPTPAADPPTAEPPAAARATEPPPAPAAAPEAAATPAAATSAAATSAQSPPAEQGLTLRFASDQDFLRLVSRGRVQVYAFDGSRVLQLGGDFRFAPAAAPGAVHELLPDTIPALMHDALRRSGEASGFQWGIAMPERMARQVREFLEQGASGELVIDRYGEVRLHDEA